MAPVIRELQRRRGRIHLTVCATAQHRVLLDQVVDPFGIPIDFDLDVMVADQTLEGLTSRILDRMAGGRQRLTITASKRSSTATGRTSGVF